MGAGRIFGELSSRFVYPKPAGASGFGNDIVSLWKEPYSLTSLHPGNYGKEGQAAGLNKSRINSDPIKGVGLALGQFKRLEVSTRWN